MSDEDDDKGRCCCCRRLGGAGTADETVVNVGLRAWRGGLDSCEVTGTARSGENSCDSDEGSEREPLILRRRGEEEEQGGEERGARAPQAPPPCATAAVACAACAPLGLERLAVRDERERRHAAEADLDERSAPATATGGAAMPADAAARRCRATADADAETGGFDGDILLLPPSMTAYGSVRRVSELASASTARGDARTFCLEFARARSDGEKSGLRGSPRGWGREGGRVFF